MFSLLLLSLVLSAPAAAAQTGLVSSDPLVASPAPLVRMQPDSPMAVEGEQVRSFDALEIHPELDICYKIRAFIFSKGQNPRFLRETTCGPKAPTAKNVEGAKPRLIPLDSQSQPVLVPER
jgi:hypothetical protein